MWSTKRLSIRDRTGVIDIGLKSAGRLCNLRYWQNDRSFSLHIKVDLPD